MDLANIDLLGLQRVLQRGTGTIIEEQEDMLFLFDTVSEAYFLACDDPDKGMEVLDRHRDREFRLLMTSDHRTGLLAFEKYGFADRLECYQTAYYGALPECDDRLTVRKAREKDLPFLMRTYHLISPEEMEKVVARGCMYLGYADGEIAGFIGEHLEGSMGLLYILPRFRRRGYASALEKHYIRDTMIQGMTPFGQVEKDNKISLRLQEKIGMTRSDDLIVWMWK